MTCKRKNEIWAMLDAEARNIIRAIYYDCKDVRMERQRGEDVLEKIFGLHNLNTQAEAMPKEPTEPKFNIGDKVRINCYSNGEVWDFVMHNRIATIKDYYVKDGVNMYIFEEEYRDFGEHWLEPYIQSNRSDVGKITIPVGVEFDDSFYDTYRYDLAKELAVAMIPNGWNMEITKRAVDLANGIIKRLKETEHGDRRTD